MAAYTRIIAYDWGISGDAVTYAVEDADGAELLAPTAMTEDPADSGCYKVKVTTMDSTWIGRELFSNGTLTETRELAPPVNVNQWKTGDVDLTAPSNPNRQMKVTERTLRVS